MNTKKGDLVGEAHRRKRKNPTEVRTKQYGAECRKHIKSEQNIINRRVNNWYTFSITPQTEENIRKIIIRELEEKKPGKYICLSYVCRYSILSEEFIEELIKLTKFNFRIRKNKKDGVVINRSYCNEFMNRIDWKNICQYQKLSEEFIERHKNDVLWDYIYRFQNLSEEFKKEHKCDYEKASLVEDSDDESENTH